MWDVLAYGVLVPASFAVLESWAQRAAAVLLTVGMGQMPAPVAFAAAVAMAAHNLWVSPKFLVAVVAALAIATGAFALVLPRNDLGWTVIVATAVVHFHRFLPPIHRQWAPLAFVVFVAAPAVVIIGPGVGVFVLLYAVVTRTPLGRYFDDFARRFE